MIYHCARCGEEVTAPYYHDGKVYGYTCINYVRPIKLSNRKDKTEYVEATILEKIPDGNTRYYLRVKGTDGVKYKFLVLIDLSSGVPFCLSSSVILREDKIYIKIRDRAGKPVWKK